MSLTLTLALLLPLTVTGSLTGSLTSSDDQCSSLPYLPSPRSLTCNPGPNSTTSLADPCSILYTLTDDPRMTDYAHLSELVYQQQLRNFGCRNAHVVVGEVSGWQLRGYGYRVAVELMDYRLRSVFQARDEGYRVEIAAEGATIKAKNYVGFVYGLQTLMQSFTCPKLTSSGCYLKYLPIVVEDQPNYHIRSLMIDTSRHYLPLPTIYQTIDSLMFNKMNTLHWHIVDEDSFPLRLNSHPELADYGAFSNEQVYTPDQIKQVIRYAMVRGVRIIPEIDTPGHAASWGLAPGNSKYACKFNQNTYKGPLDVTLDATYKLMEEVFEQIFEIFSDPYVHLGGDEVSLTCMENSTQFIKAEGIKPWEIELHYRRKQRQILKKLNPDKKFIYWMNQYKIQLEPEDIIHWWGNQLPQAQNQIIISQFGPYYIDFGTGNIFGVPYGSYATWIDIYRVDFDQLAQSYGREKVLGGALTLWGQTNNQYTHMLKVWIRGSAFAERIWSSVEQKEVPDFLGKLTTHERLLNRRGIPTAPATSQACELTPVECKMPDWNTP